MVGPVIEKLVLISAMEVGGVTVMTPDRERDVALCMLGDWKLGAVPDPFEVRIWPVDPGPTEVILLPSK